MVPVEHSELGARLLVECADERVVAVVADGVFFKPDHAKGGADSRLEPGRVTRNYPCATRRSGTRVGGRRHYG